MIRAFSVCVNYSDMLKLVHPFNKSFYDSYHIITSPDDTNTIDYCRENGIECFQSKAYLINGSSFNKAAMLNELLEHLEKQYPDDWFLSMDVDIIVDCKHELPVLNRDFIYGSMRKIFTDPDYFEHHLTLDKVRDEGVGYFQQLGMLPYAQVGYFQLYFKKGCRFNTKYKTASDCDTDFFYDHFSRTSTGTFHPDLLVCYHLGEIEKNWSGRKTTEWSFHA